MIAKKKSTVQPGQNISFMICTYMHHDIIWIKGRKHESIQEGKMYMFEKHKFESIDSVIIDICRVT